MDHKLEKILDQLSTESATALGERLLALVLYGSGATGEFNPRRSDLNLLFLLDQVDAPALEALLPPFARWRKRAPLSPLLLDRDDLSRSQDSFPLEFLELRLHHRVLRGQDPTGMIQIEPNALRLQCEREARGKVILLQQEFLYAGSDRAAGERLLAASLKPFIAIMRAMLFLTGVDTPPPSTAGTLEAFARIYPRPLPHLRRVLDFRAARPRLAAPEMASLFAGYLAELKELSRWIDRWVPGA